MNQLDTDLVESLRKRSDMIVAAHERAGRKIVRPFTLEDLAIEELARLRSELSTIRDSTIEDCARVADAQTKFATVIFTDRTLQTSYDLACEQIADGIRALKDSTPREE